MEWLRVVREPYLAPANAYASTLYVQNMVANMDAIYSIRLVVLIVFIGGVVLLFMLYFNPLGMP